MEQEENCAEIFREAGELARGRGAAYVLRESSALSTLACERREQCFVRHEENGGGRPREYSSGDLDLAEYKESLRESRFDPDASRLALWNARCETVGESIELLQAVRRAARDGGVIAGPAAVGISIGSPEKKARARVRGDGTGVDNDARILAKIAPTSTSTGGTASAVGSTSMAEQQSKRTMRISSSEPMLGRKRRQEEFSLRVKPLKAVPVHERLVIKEEHGSEGEQDEQQQQEERRDSHAMRYTLHVRKSKRADAARDYHKRRAAKKKTPTACGFRKAAKAKKDPEVEQQRQDYLKRRVEQQRARREFVSKVRNQVQDNRLFSHAARQKVRMRPQSAGPLPTSPGSPTVSDWIESKLKGTSAAIGFGDREWQPTETMQHHGPSGFGMSSKVIRIIDTGHAAADVVIPSALAPRNVVNLRFGKEPRRTKMRKRPKSAVVGRRR